MDKIRIFIAADFSQSVKQDIAKSFDSLNLDESVVRAQPAEKMHITLRFFRYFPIADLDQLMQVMETVASETKILKVAFTKAEINGGNKARTLVLAPANLQGLQELFNCLNDTLEIAEVAAREFRRFKPHITLARVNGVASEEELVNFQKWQPAFKIDIDSLTLFESKLLPGGSEFIVLNSYPLT